MNRPTKRLLALVGSAFVGATAAIALASPAHAHHPIVEGTAICQADGQYKITWKVSNGNWSNRYAKITVINPTVDKPINGFAIDTKIDPGATVTGTQLVPGSTTSAGLTITARWYNQNGTYAGIEETNPNPPTYASGLNGDKCEPAPVPTAKFTPDCAGVIVHIVNPTNGAIDFTINAGGGWTKTVPVAAKDQADVVVPAANANVAIVVLAGKDQIAKGTPWVRPADCPKPSPLAESTCDKFTISLTNPQGGLPTTATVTYGTQTATKDVAPGKTETLSFDASSTTEATVKFSGWDEVHKVEFAKPANCGGLPQTGASTGTYVASGTGLAALGALVFFMARRRQVRLRRMASM